MFICRYGALVATSSCAVAHLKLLPDHTALALAAAVIHHQASLGRLRSLTITLGGAALWEPRAGDVLRVASTVEGLTSLTLLYSGRDTGNDPRLPRALPRTAPPSSLKELTISLNHQQETLRFLLKAHAATLEVVAFQNWPDLPPSGLAALLSALPNLRRLKGPALPDMNLVVRCMKLTEVTISYESYPSCTALDDTAAFLRAATHLTKVELWAKDGAAGTTLLQALAASGQSRVQELTIDDAAEVLLALTAALPRLPHLLGLHSYYCLSAEQLTPLLRSAPGLVDVHVSVLNWDCCTHANLHRPELKQLLAANPRLHLKVRLRECRGDKCNGGTCKGMQCHQELREPGERDHVGLFSHEQGAGCESKLHKEQDVDTIWIKL